MSDSARFTPASGARRRGSVLLLALLAAGCSSGSTSTPAVSGDAPTVSVSGAAPAVSSGVGSAAPAASRAASAPPANPSATPSLATGATASPAAAATCRSLTVARARALLGRPDLQGVRDLRASDSTRQQLDGCSYGDATGARLSYLVWKPTAQATVALLQNSLPAVQQGARHFDPKIRERSAGAVITAGPNSVAQVNALRRGIVVQVTVVGPDAARAVSAAVSAATALVGG